MLCRDDAFTYGYDVGMTLFVIDDHRSRRCDTSDDCTETVDGSSLFCADTCLSMSSDYTTTYGAAFGCSETGSGAGYCQKCDSQASGVGVGPVAARPGAGLS